jgi:hypothetical protein
VAKPKEIFFKKHQGRKDRKYKKMITPSDGDIKTKHKQNYDRYGEYLRFVYLIMCIYYLIANCIMHLFICNPLHSS